MIKIKNYINGELSDSTIENYIDIYNPSIGKVFAQCPDSTETDLFKMFLREVQVRSGGMYAHDMHQYQRADSIDDLCFKELNILV